MQQPPVARAYFALQALAGAVWWILVATVPLVRELTLGGLPALPIALADLPLFVGASALAACNIAWAAWVAAGWTTLVTLAMAAYATVTTQAGWGALAMIAATIGSAIAAIVIARGSFPAHWILLGPLGMREARPATRARNLLATAGQITVFWGLFLVVIPVVLTWFERRWQVDLPVPAAVRIAGLVVLGAASALGLWSGATMASRGDGTPLPSATARRLVIAGPYRFVRNPMAVAGIAQGAAVGLLLGSWLVVVWALCGSLVWNWLIRPIEEGDLEERFGDAFVAYRDRVSCWVPRHVWPRIVDT
ncbi:protein-S-isoprenylcysteine O-methyltransferase [Microbacterium sorbitolivorans]|uniref:Isoprenylcysteine carboxylmethyltransferase family protein n=1 Tax=Microbacterium sorbitolivorans TaxID=1867410 RepID=A0A367Y862_9MICO|nr:isoprenylcysteine carboxylmethyltransferase family protein [Microbacterium sorbitolivorans]RCK61191.1 isoprenylcysteine carboxylmethyltransferase family protein [Microbacterium sorbitolivorans]GGF34250.1 protein-S-isoprenylcysteine O-methyltransferase [Microbacterium sorbitolivorans]